MFRHTWTAARLQTLDQGAPVSLYTVSRELGHGSEEMVKRVYAHLGTVRHRSEVVEFRVEQHAAALKDRLGVLRSGTTNDTTKATKAETETPPTSKQGRDKEFRSGPGATRTRDLLLRRQALYPTELRTLGFGSGKLASRGSFRNRRSSPGSQTGSPSIPSGTSTLNQSSIAGKRSTVRTGPDGIG